MKLRIVLNKSQALQLAEQIMLTHRVRMPDGWLADAMARDTFPFQNIDLGDPTFAVEPTNWRERWRLLASTAAGLVRFSIMSIMR